MESVFHPGSSLPSPSQSSGNRWLGRILKGKLKKGFISLQHLQTGTNTGDTSDESNAERLTKMDSKLMATDQLLVTARRLDSAGRLIQDFIDYACSNKASISGIKRKSQQLKRGVVPMIIKASSTLEGIGTILAPAAGTKYVFNRNECKRKRDVVDESSTLSSDLQLVMNYISETDAQEITPPKKKRTITTRKVTESVSLPEPKSGEYYTKTEVINIISPIDKGSHKLASTMAEMVRLRYVPVKVCALQRMLRKKRGGKAIVDTPWSIGRTGIASPDEMKGFAEFVNKQQGRTFDKSDIRDFLVKTQRDRLTAAGYVPLGSIEPTSSTVDNYMALAANDKDVKAVVETVSKTTTRQTAETSWRASAALAVLKAATHLIPVDNIPPDIAAEFKSLPDSSRLLTDMTSAALGDIPLIPVHSHLIYSVDETGVYYLVDGPKGSKPKFVLASKSSYNNRGTHGLYRTTDSNKMDGIRVKINFAFAASGECFPLFVTVSGLTEKELPDHEFVHVKIPGLCIGGDVSVGGSLQDGHLFLMRNTAGAEKEMHKHYHEHILIPGINAQRKKYHDFDIDAGSPVPKDLHTVTWCDGALSQIAATKCNAELFRENEITCNKQNAARTAVEQSCDTGTVFRALKASLPSYTVGDGPPGPMKQRILRLFDNLVLKLKPTKKNALVDFLSILSGLATRVCTKSNIQSGFIAAGK